MSAVTLSWILSIPTAWWISTWGSDSQVTSLVSCPFSWSVTRMGDQIGQDQRVGQLGGGERAWSVAVEVEGTEPDHTDMEGEGEHGGRAEVGCLRPERRPACRLGRQVRHEDGAAGGEGVDAGALADGELQVLQPGADRVARVHETTPKSGDRGVADFAEYGRSGAGDSQLRHAQIADPADASPGGELAVRNEQRGPLLSASSVHTPHLHPLSP